MKPWSGSSALRSTGARRSHSGRSSTLKTSGRSTRPSSELATNGCASRWRGVRSSPTMAGSTDETRRAIETVWRIESARLIGGLARVVRDLDVAEDLAQEALIVALEQWPESGIPQNPGAWLMTTAKRRGIDRLRRQRMLEQKHAELERAPMQDLLTTLESAFDAIDNEVDDDLL